MESTAVGAKASGNIPVSSVTHSSSLKHFRTLLSVMLTPGLSPNIDDVCETKLGITANPSGGIGHVSDQVTTLYNYQNVRNAWCISGLFRLVCDRRHCNPQNIVPLQRYVVAYNPDASLN
ncbi:hypothetical protein JVU11DRAFT_3123 [Chiua virens]|nr:hypothetical protein JVU11DRAFT_3123 [Chiua virens]